MKALESAKLSLNPRGVKYPNWVAKIQLIKVCLKSSTPSQHLAHISSSTVPFVSRLNLCGSASFSNLQKNILIFVSISSCHSFLHLIFRPYAWAEVEALNSQIQWYTDQIEYSQSFSKGHTNMSVILLKERGVFRIAGTSIGKKVSSIKLPFHVFFLLLDEIRHIVNGTIRWPRWYDLRMMRWVQPSILQNLNILPIIDPPNTPIFQYTLSHNNITPCITTIMSHLCL